MCLRNKVDFYYITIIIIIIVISDACYRLMTTQKFSATFPFSFKIAIKENETS